MHRIEIHVLLPIEQAETRQESLPTPLKTVARDVEFFTSAREKLHRPYSLDFFA